MSLKAKEVNARIQRMSPYVLVNSNYYGAEEPTITLDGDFDLEDLEAFCIELRAILAARDQP